MGECCSKEEDYDPDDHRRASRRSRVEGDGFSSIRVDSSTREDEQIVEVLRKEFQMNPQMFLLNNLLMTPQFFENYGRDRELCLSNVNKMEKDLNATLLKNENMKCICPDVIFELVNNNLKYRPLHGPKKHKSEPITPTRMFVINDTVEVVNSMEVPQYTSIDKPAIQVRIEESARKGFVRLRQIDTDKSPRSYPSNYNEPSGSGIQTPDEEFYEYASITDLRTPKLLQSVGRPEHRDNLPATCFTTRKIKKPNHEIQDLQDANVDLTEDDFFDDIVYIDAKEFMTYFKNSLFPNSLGRSLGFTQDEIDLAKSIPGKIFCNLTDDDDNPIPCEVIPSVAIDWPDEQTFEFITREERPTIIDKNTGIRYKWPTDQMINEIRTLKSVVVPKGYWKKKGKYSDASIEWEIAFPKAERYLETRMSHAQLRCFLFLLLLHKNLIEPFTQHNGLLVEHIRCHMFWECEANYRDWPEHRLGTKVVKVIENLNQRLSRSELSDYFIKQKNHFRNIPGKYLQFAQKVFHEVLQSPMVHFIKCLRCVRYSSGKFYAPFEFKEFYRMLTHVQGYKLVNPNLMNSSMYMKRKKYVDPQTQWEHLQEIQRRKEFLEKKEKEKRKQEEKNEDAVSVDSIDLEWVCEKQFEIFKTKAILTQFIKTFIAIAKDIARFNGTENQRLLYLKQASYLNIILENTSRAFVPESREFWEEINSLKMAAQKSAVLRISDIPPATPVRNSIQFDFSISQQLKTNVVNLNNLHNAYNSGGINLAVRSPVSRAKSDIGYRKSVARKTVGFVAQ